MIHHVIFCLMAAFVSKRMLIVDKSEEIFGLDHHFLPLRSSSFAGFKNGGFTILITEWHISSFLVLQLDGRSPIKEHRICHSVFKTAECYRMVNLRHSKKGNIFGNFNDFKQF